MREFRIGDIVINDHSDPFVIAEIGSNHNGNLDLCKKLFKIAKFCGADAVKLQKRNNKKLFTKALYNMPYENENSYGKTYGEHREALDWFGWDEFVELKCWAEDLEILFFATPFEEDSANFLHTLDVPLFKVASCDVRNIPLIKQLAEYSKPLIISTGGANMADVDRIYDTIMPINPQLAFLHCISTYPNDKYQLNLNVIPKMRERYPEIVIGFSSHHPAVYPNLLACLLGAQIIEVHITLNRAAKGTDHAFSLEPKAIETLCEDLKRIKPMLGNGEKRLLPEEAGGFIKKMGKAIHPARTLKAGEILTKDNIILKAPAEGIAPYKIEEILGKIIISDVSTAETIEEDKLE